MLHRCFRQDASLRCQIIISLLMLVAVGLIAGIERQVVEPLFTLPLYVLVVAITSWTTHCVIGFVFALICTAVSYWVSGYGGTPPTGIAAAKMVMFIFAIAAICQFRKVLAYSNRLAETDPLTGLTNTRQFLDRVSAEINRSKRTGRPVSIAYIDCDHFKQVNDSRGHVAGDQVLKTIGEVLLSTCRNYDTPARLGGDEFALLLPETSSIQAMHCVYRINGRLRDRLQALPTAVTLSIGVHTTTDLELTPEEFLHEADQLMYQAKQSGGDTLVFTEDRHGDTDELFTSR